MLHKAWTGIATFDKVLGGAGPSAYPSAGGGVSLDFKSTDLKRRIVMTEKIIAPYGSWKSPITSDLIVAGTVGLSEIVLDGDDIYWIEGRAAESGRNCIVRRSPDGTTRDVTPPGFNARTTVHEYG